MTTTDAGLRSGDVALIVGGGPGISASCARLFAAQGMKVAIAARNPDKPVLMALKASSGVSLYRCDASHPAAVAALFHSVQQDLGSPTLVVHNIDGRVREVFRKTIIELDPPLNEPDPATFYTPGPAGHTDYPTMAGAA